MRSKPSVRLAILFCLCILSVQALSQTASIPLFSATGLVVTITSPTSTAVICYTLDGSAPAAVVAGTCSSGFSVANGGTVTESYGTPVVINALATAVGFTNSAVASSPGIQVNAVLTDGQGNIQKSAYLAFQLWNCGNNVPQVTANPSVIVSSQFSMRANPTTGIISGLIYGNNQISCGGIQSSQWFVTEYKTSSTAVGATQQYYILGAPGTFDPSVNQPTTASPILPGFTLLFANPVGSQTWAQPIGTEAKFEGTFDFTLATVLGLNQGGSSAAVWGQISGTLANQSDLQAALNNLVTIAPASPAQNNVTATNSTTNALVLNAPQGAASTLYTLLVKDNMTNPFFGVQAGGSVNVGLNCSGVAAFNVCGTSPGWLMGVDQYCVYYGTGTQIQPCNLNGTWVVAMGGLSGQNYTVPFIAYQDFLYPGTNPFSAGGLVQAQASGPFIVSKALVSGVTAVTQTLGDNSTKLATDAFVLANAAASPMTTLGDDTYGGASGVFTRMAGQTVPGTYYKVEKPLSGAATAEIYAKAGIIPNPQTGATYTYLATDSVNDRAGLTTFTNAGSIAATLPQAGTTGFDVNWVNASCDSGAGSLTITPTISTISYWNGSTFTSGQTSMILSTGQCAFIYSNNTNYFAFQLTSGGGSAADSIWTGGGITAITPTGTQLYPVNGLTGSANANSGSVMVRSGTVDKLYVNLTATETGGATLAFTVLKNGSSQSVTCTVSATTCNDTAHTFTFAAGDIIAMQTVQTGTGSSQIPQWGVGYH